ncbi:MAG: N-acetylmuramoyl-L-alanine amidase [Solirubrobacterales bacterium]
MKLPSLRRGERVRPRIVVHGHSPNVSERLGVPLNLMVLHSTESHNRPGDSDLAGVSGWFDNPSAQVSCHVVVDADGHSARCVPDRLKAWQVGTYNSAALGIEQIGHALQGRLAWRRSWRQLRETARWLAHWSILHGIPLRRAAVAGGAVTRSGVITHAELGAEGGGHFDPGAYPFNRVLWLARAYRAALLAQR